MEGFICCSCSLRVFLCLSQEKLNWLQQCDVFSRNQIKSWCWGPNSSLICSAQPTPCLNYQLEPVIHYFCNGREVYCLLFLSTKTLKHTHASMLTVCLCVYALLFLGPKTRSQLFFFCGDWMVDPTHLKVFLSVKTLIRFSIQLLGYGL